VVFRRHEPDEKGCDCGMENLDPRGHSMFCSYKKQNPPIAIATELHPEGLTLEKYYQAIKITEVKK
jgi:hypothetical protein